MNDGVVYLEIIVILAGICCALVVNAIKNKCNNRIEEIEGGLEIMEKEYMFAVCLTDGSVYKVKVTTTNNAPMSYVFHCAIDECVKRFKLPIQKIEFADKNCDDCENSDKCYPELGYCNRKMERDTKAVERFAKTGRR